MEKHKCLIIGSGPAGFTAAIYASRANMSPVLYQGMQPGGQLTTTTDVDNFPGYPKGVNGTQMMIELEEQAKRFGTDVRMGMITKVDFSGPVHKVWVDNSEINLTVTEMKILSCLCKSPGKVFTRSQINKLIQGENVIAVEVHHQRQPGWTGAVHATQRCAHHRRLQHDPQLPCRELPGVQQPRLAEH